MEALRRTGATIESDTFDLKPFRIVFLDGAWQALDLEPPRRGTVAAVRSSSDLDPALTEVRLHFEDGARTAAVTLWLAPGTGASAGTPLPFLLGLDGKGARKLTWDVRMTTGNGPPQTPDKDRVALWVHRHAARIDDPEFLVTVSDYFWHNQELDRPPGSYSRLVDLNLRALELAPHAVSVYGTTAWLLWSNWVSWKQDPQSIPGGGTKLDEALALLARGDRANPGNAEFLYEAGTVLLPLVQYHRPDLAPLAGSYLRRAAEAARGRGAIALKAWRAYAGHLYRHGRYEQAARWYRKLLRQFPETEVAERRLREMSDAKKAAAGTQQGTANQRE